MHLYFFRISRIYRHGFYLLVVSVLSGLILISSALAQETERLHTISSETVQGWVLEKTHSTYTNVYISFPFGAHSDPEGKEGLLFLITELLEANKGWVLPDIHTSLTIPTQDWIKLGGHFETDRFILKIGFPNTFGKGITQVIKSLIAKPTIKSNIFNDIKKATIQRFDENFDEITARQLSILYKQAVKPERWHRSLYGQRSTLQDLDIDDIRTFFKNNLRRDGARILVSGAMNASDGYNFLKDIYAAIPKGAPKAINVNDNEPVTINLPGFMERIEDNNNAPAILFAFSTPGWKSRNFLKSWLILQIMGCNESLWLKAQLDNLIKTGIESARLCWQFNRDEGIAVGYIRLSDAKYDQISYNALTVLFQNVATKHNTFFDWYNLGKNLLEAEWGTKALGSSFNDGYLPLFLPITPLAWDRDNLDKISESLTLDGIPHEISALFSPDRMHFIILK